MDELKRIVSDLQELSDQPVTKESYTKMLELFHEFLKCADEALPSDTEKDNDAAQR